MNANIKEIAMVTSKYFKEPEFARLGCSLQDMSQDLMDKLDQCRALAGVPFVLTSAYRDPEKNKKVGGVDKSAHTKGLGVDIACTNGAMRYIIFVNAINVGFNRIGLGKNFVHLDIDKTLPQKVIFDYYE